MCRMCDIFKTPGPEWTGKMNWDQVDRIKEELDLTWPLTIEVRDDLPEHEAGRTKVNDEHKHLIHLNSNNTVRQSNFVLLHELRHCYQHEDASRKGQGNQRDDYMLMNLLFGYENNPFELDANDFAFDWHERVQLTY